jgi:hypothetical protein
MTSLTNRAMPLIRYETGDRASWDDRPCGCTRRESLLRLTRTRSVRVLAPDGERRLTSLDIEKLFAQLDVQAVALAEELGGVVVRYRGAELPATIISAVVASIRGLLGRPQQSTCGASRPRHRPDDRRRRRGRPALARPRAVDAPARDRPACQLCRAQPRSPTLRWSAPACWPNAIPSSGS